MNPGLSDIAILTSSLAVREHPLVVHFTMMNSGYH